MQIRVTRPLLFNGVAYPADATIDVTALEAADALASGRAILADPDDAAACDAAVREQRDRTLARLGAADRTAGTIGLLRRRA